MALTHIFKKEMPQDSLLTMLEILFFWWGGYFNLQLETLTE